MWPIIVNVPDTAAVGTVFFQTSIELGPDSRGFNTLIHILPGSTGVGAGAPPALAFAAPGPNPAWDQTRFEFSLPAAADVALEVFDVTGARVRTLVSGRREAGPHAERWDLRDEAGRRVSAGVYLARITTGNWTATRRLAVVR
jgi:hypothetical protein